MVRKLSLNCESMDVHISDCRPEVEGAENKVDVGKLGLKCTAYQI